MRKTLVASLVAGTMLMVPAVASASTDEYFSGSGDRSNCYVSKVRDRGVEYLIQVSHEDDDGSTHTHVRAVRRLPGGSNYVILETRELGTVTNWACGY